MSEQLSYIMANQPANKKWLAVDLDGTMAHYDGWKGIDHIGAPVKGIVDKIIQRHKEGWGIAIFTARVSEKHEAEQAEKAIWAWVDKYDLHFISGITCIKHKHFVEFWDDRAIQVIKNTGEFVINTKGDGSHVCEIEPPHGIERVGQRVKVDQAIRPIMEPDPLNKIRNSTVIDVLQAELNEVNLQVGCSLDVQVGGAHYKDMLIQPAEYCEYNNIPALESAVIKYVSRHMKKNGVQDLEKAKDLINMIIEMRYEPTGLNHLAARINSKRHNQFEKK